MKCKKCEVEVSETNAVIEKFKYGTPAYFCSEEHRKEYMSKIDAFLNGEYVEGF